MAYRIIPGTRFPAQEIKIHTLASNSCCIVSMYSLVRPPLKCTISVNRQISSADDAVPYDTLGREIKISLSVYRETRKPYPYRVGSQRYDSTGRWSPVREAFKLIDSCCCWGWCGPNRSELALGFCVRVQRFLWSRTLLSRSFTFTVSSLRFFSVTFRLTSKRFEY